MKGLWEEKTSLRYTVMYVSRFQYFLYFLKNDCFLGVVDFFVIVLERSERTAKLVRIFFGVRGGRGLGHQP